MANVLLFPDRLAFLQAQESLQQADIPFEAVMPPDFCEGLTCPCIQSPASIDEIVVVLSAREVQLSGIIPYRPFMRDIPSDGPADPRCKSATGELQLVSMRPSVTDPLKLRAELVFEKSIGPLIPLMARFIRGGCYRREAPVLAFEEEHRLLVFTPDRLVMSRVDDLLDFWIMLRCSAELILSAWDRMSSLDPETDQRSGIGAIEIFKRLPGDNCGKCGSPNCMEFAIRMFMGRCNVSDCIPMAEAEHSERLESLWWLLHVLGLAHEHDRQQDAPRQHLEGLEPHARTPAPEASSEDENCTLTEDR